MLFGFDLIYTNIMIYEGGDTQVGIWDIRGKKVRYGRLGVKKVGIWEIGSWDMGYQG